MAAEPSGATASAAPADNGGGFAASYGGSIGVGGGAAPLGAPARDAPSDAPRSGMRRVIGWVLLIVVVIAAIYFLLQHRQTIATLWPKSASLYAAIGAPVNVMGLDFRDVKPSQSFEAGQPLLELKGRIVNIADHRIPVPQVRVALIDDEAREVYHWTFDTGAGPLAPGAAAAFATRLSAPPEEARRVNIRFVEAAGR